MQGFVVGVRASKVFCLHYLAMNTLYVPQVQSETPTHESKPRPPNLKTDTLTPTPNPDPLTQSAAAFRYLECKDLNRPTHELN